MHPFKYLQDQCTALPKKPKIFQDVLTKGINEWRKNDFDSMGDIICIETVNVLMNHKYDEVHLLLSQKMLVILSHRQLCNDFMCKVSIDKISSP